MNPTLTPPDRHADDFARRRVLAAGLTLSGAIWMSVPRLARAVQATLLPTPPNDMGPFYPAVKPAETDADLTTVAGRSARAAGTILYLSGQVQDAKGRPLAGAQIELWQANAFGRYAHPSDSDASGPLDPGFQGYALLSTDAQGNYRLKTIKPAPYTMRTAHLHLKVASGTTRLTTQMFFEGEAGNERDFLFRQLDRDQRRAATGRFVERGPSMEADALAVSWNIVLGA